MYSMQKRIAEETTRHVMTDCPGTFNQKPNEWSMKNLRTEPQMAIQLIEKWKEKAKTQGTI